MLCVDRLLQWPCNGVSLDQAAENWILRRLLKPHKGESRKTKWLEMFKATVEQYEPINSTYFRANTNAWLSTEPCAVCKFYYLCLIFWLTKGLVFQKTFVKGSKGKVQFRWFVGEVVFKKNKYTDPALQRNDIYWERQNEVVKKLLAVTDRVDLVFKNSGELSLNYDRIMEYRVLWKQWSMKKVVLGVDQTWDYHQRLMKCALYPNRYMRWSEMKFMPYCVDFQTAMKRMSVPEMLSDSRGASSSRSGTSGRGGRYDSASGTFEPRRFPPGVDEMPLEQPMSMNTPTSEGNGLGYRFLEIEKVSGKELVYKPICLHGIPMVAIRSKQGRELFKCALKVPGTVRADHVKNMSGCEAVMSATFYENIMGMALVWVPLKTELTFCKAHSKPCVSMRMHKGRIAAMCPAYGCRTGYLITKGTSNVYLHVLPSVEANNLCMLTRDLLEEWNERISSQASWSENQVIAKVGTSVVNRLMAQQRLVMQGIESVDVPEILAAGLLYGSRAISDDKPNGAGAAAIMPPPAPKVARKRKAAVEGGNSKPSAKKKSTDSQSEASLAPLRETAAHASDRDPVETVATETNPLRGDDPDDDGEDEFDDIEEYPDS